MCGIIGYTGHESAAERLLDGLARLEYRGYDSAGLAVLDAKDKGALHVVREVGKISGLRKAVEAYGPDKLGNCGIGHTRWATHGAPTQDNAHPHRSGPVVVVHNGIIENYRSLRDELLSRGREIKSETDTEIVAHLVDEAYRARKDGDLHAALRDVVAKLVGAWALCVMHESHPGQIAIARHAAPLLVGLQQQRSATEPAVECFVASDVAAILSYTRSVVDLSDGDTALIGSSGIVEHFDADGEAVERKKRVIDWSPMAAEKQGFRHFMLKEICEQPRAIRDTIIGHVDSDANTVKVEELSKFSFNPHTRMHILACGTSWHAGLVAKYLIESLAKIPCNVELASEFRYRDAVVNEGDLALAISQSGETADTLAAIQEAKRLGAQTLSICNVIDSTIARTTDAVVYTHAGPEISVASTKAFTTQLTMVSLLAVALGHLRKTLDPEREQELLLAIRNLPVHIDSVLDQRAAVKTIARRYSLARDFLYLGRGLAYPVALEGALKLKEISYVHAEGYASGEMKHGPIALIDENMPVVVIALRGEQYDKSVASLEEVRSRGGRVIAVATAGDDRIGDIVEDVLLVPNVDPVLAPIVASVPLQLLAYFIADLKGTDVDQPRNLAKSVTVE